MACWWKVRAWTRITRHRTGATATWTMGLLAPGDWKASWIGMQQVQPKPKKKSDLPGGPPAPFFRKAFTLDKPVARAMLTVTARGLVEPHLSTARGDIGCLHPRVDRLRQTHPIPHVRCHPEAQAGRERHRAILGDGWYAGYVGRRKERGHYGLQTSILGNSRWSTPTALRRLSFPTTPGNARKAPSAPPTS